MFVIQGNVSGQTESPEEYAAKLYVLYQKVSQKAAGAVV
jgi:hypothetical protein